MKKYFILLLAFHVFVANDISGQSECPQIPYEKAIRFKERQKLPFYPPSFGPMPYSPPDGDTTRIIWWMHGLGGNAGAWEDAGAAVQDNVAPGFDARKIASRWMDYALFQSSLSSAAVKIKSDMFFASPVQDTAARLRNMIIAHSQGGLVSRYLDMHYDEVANTGLSLDMRRFGGIATFGSAHQGAQIINNALPDSGGINLATQFFEEGCQALNSGKLREIDAMIDLNIQQIPPFVLSKYLLKYLFKGNVVEKLADSLCSTVSTIIPNTSYFDEFDQEIAQEYKVDAPELGELNGDTSSIPKVAFFGIEDNPVFWRTLHYLLNDPNDEDYFGANNDDITVAFADTNRIRYKTRASHWKKLNENLPFILSQMAAGNVSAEQVCQNLGLNLDSICSLNILNSSVIVDIQRGWLEGVEWWETADDRYKVLIGALEPTIQQTGWECWCRIKKSDGTVVTDWHLSGFATQNPDECQTAPLGIGGLIEECAWRPLLETVYVEKPSDGVVLAESASMYPDGLGGGAKAVLLPGSSHMQMRNDANTKTALQDLFDGMHGPWFFTDKK